MSSCNDSIQHFNGHRTGVCTQLQRPRKNVGGLLVPLPLIVAGISLYTSYQDSNQSDISSSRSNTPFVTTAFILVFRFILWPIVSVDIFYAIAKDWSILASDPMLWFAMMLMPTGPLR